MKIYHAAFLLILTLLISGCASTPPAVKPLTQESKSTQDQSISGSGTSLCGNWPADKPGFLAAQKDPRWEKVSLVPSEFPSNIPIYPSARPLYRFYESGESLVPSQYKGEPPYSVIFCADTDIINAYNFYKGNTLYPPWNIRIQMKNLTREFVDLISKTGDSGVLFAASQHDFAKTKAQNTYMTFDAIFIDEKGKTVIVVSPFVFYSSATY